MLTLRDILTDARKSGKPVFHFNVATYEQFRAFAKLAEEYPLILGESDGERKYFDLEHLVRLVRLEREKGKPLFVNADHSKSLESAKRAATLGCDAVIIDVAELPKEENARQTKEFVGFVRQLTPQILVESELNYIKGSSRVSAEKTEVKPADLTDPDEGAQFVAATGIDIFAPSVGNIHGISATPKQLDFDRIGKIREKTDAFLVLHGASGIPFADLKKAGERGINIIHINTEIRAAWRASLDVSLAARPGNVVPYDILTDVVEAIRKKALEYLTIFG